MHLSVRQAAAYLNVDESTLRRWIAQRALPVHRVDERLMLNAIELWEWATEHGVPASRALLDQAKRTPDRAPPLDALLRAGGVFHHVPGGTKSEVLRAVVDRLPLPPDVDRAFLLDVLEAREAMGSTGIGDGIAIPHVRNPILLHVDRPSVTLCLLESPVDFDAIDGQPVHALFTVVSASVPEHLAILAHLGFALRDPELRALLRTRADAERIIARVSAIEHEKSAPAAARSPAP